MLLLHGWEGAPPTALCSPLTLLPNFYAVFVLKNHKCRSESTRRLYAEGSAGSPGLWCW